MLKVKLTFVGVWVKMPDVRVMAEMSKTNFQNTMCNNSNKIKRTWFFAITAQKFIATGNDKWHTCVRDEQKSNAFFSSQTANSLCKYVHKC